MYILYNSFIINAILFKSNFKQSWKSKLQLDMGKGEYKIKNSPGGPGKGYIYMSPQEE